MLPVEFVVPINTNIAHASFLTSTLLQFSLQPAFGFAAQKEAGHTFGSYAPLSCIYLQPPFACSSFFRYASHWPPSSFCQMFSSWNSSYALILLIHKMRTNPPDNQRSNLVLFCFLAVTLLETPKFFCTATESSMNMIKSVLLVGVILFVWIGLSGLFVCLLLVSFGFFLCLFCLFGYLGFCFFFLRFCWGFLGCCKKQL